MKGGHPFGNVIKQPQICKHASMLLSADPLTVSPGHRFLSFALGLVQHQGPENSKTGHIRLTKGGGATGMKGGGGGATGSQRASMRDSICHCPWSCRDAHQGRHLPSTTA